MDAGIRLMRPRLRPVETLIRISGSRRRPWLVSTSSSDGDTRQTLLARAPTLGAGRISRVLDGRFGSQTGSYSNFLICRSPASLASGRNTGNLSLMLQTGILIEEKEWTELRVVACRVGKMDPGVASSFAPELRADR